jgi:amino acid permease
VPKQPSLYYRYPACSFQEIVVKKTLGFISVFSISAGAMISSGLFVLPGMAFARSGPAVFLSYFLAGSVALTTVLSLSELITAMPKAGGDYFYVSRSFGHLFGTVTGLLSWFALSLIGKCPGAAEGTGTGKQYRHKRFCRNPPRHR